MSFFQLVRREMQGSPRRLLVMAGLGGISTASILAAINTGAQAADSGKPSLWAAMLFVVALFHSKSRQLATAAREASEWENRLFNRLMDLLDGFKEVRLNSARSEDLYSDIVEVSRTAANIKIRTQAETFRRIFLLQSSMYAMLGAIAFVVPVLSDTLGGASISKTVTALVFILGACFGL